jgi:simple sugar transport system permease protein
VIAPGAPGTPSTTFAPAPTEKRAPSGVSRRTGALLAAGGALLLLAILQRVTDVPDLTSSGTFEAALVFAVPIGLAGLGGLFSERAGVVNIGLEGMMILGTWFGAWGALNYGPWWGVVLGVVGGALGGLLHAVATVTFEVDHIVSGVAINILGAGIARFLSSIEFTSAGGGVTQSPILQRHIGEFNVPFLAGGEVFGWKSPDTLRWVQQRHWFFLSDAAALFRAPTGGVSWLTLLAIVLFPLAYWLLWRTRFGLRLRSAGENPGAAESLGVGVYTMKYCGVLISGGLAGLAGAYLVLVSGGLYKEGQTGGRGFIGLAAMIFGNWRPGGVAIGAGLFGFADALQNRSDDAVHSLLLFAAVALAVAAIYALYRRLWARAGLCAALAAVFFLWYGTTDLVPTEFVSFTPHIITLVVLATATQRLRPPAADGLRYRKGEAG